MSKLSEIIKRRRLELGWTQEYAASKIGRGVSAYSRLEEGKTTPRQTTLIMIANAFGINAEALIRASLAMPEDVDATDDCRNQENHNA